MTLMLEWLALMSAALFAGGALYVAIAEHPARVKAGVAVALAQFGPSYQRAAPWQASTAALCFIAGAVAAVLAAQWVWLVGGVMVGAAIPFTLVAMMPTTRRILSGQDLRDEQAVRLLGRWARLHWIRSALGLAGLVVLVVAALRR